MREEAQVGMQGIRMACYIYTAVPKAIRGGVRVEKTWRRKRRYKREEGEKRVVLPYAGQDRIRIEARLATRNASAPLCRRGRAQSVAEGV